MSYLFISLAKREAFYFNFPIDKLIKKTKTKKEARRKKIIKEQVSIPPPI